MEHVSRYHYLHLAILLAVDMLLVSLVDSGDDVGRGIEGVGRGDYFRAEMACWLVNTGMEGNNSGGGDGDDGARQEAELGVREMLMNWADGYDA